MKKDHAEDKRQIEKRRNIIWTVKITLITLILTLFISAGAELFTQSASSVIISLITLLALIVLGVFFDVIGIAATAADEAPFLAMAAKRIRGARQSLWLVRNAHMVSNICNDVVGDICGIVSGAAATVIVLKLMPGQQSMIWANIVCAGVLAAMTVGAKAAFKRLGLRQWKSIIGSAGRVLAVFDRNPGKIKGKQKDMEI